MHNILLVFMFCLVIVELPPWFSSMSVAMISDVHRVSICLSGFKSSTSPFVKVDSQMKVVFWIYFFPNCFSIHTHFTFSLLHCINEIGVLLWNKPLDPSKLSFNTFWLLCILAHGSYYSQATGDIAKVPKSTLPLICFRDGSPPLPDVNSSLMDSGNLT